MSKKRTIASYFGGGVVSDVVKCGGECVECPVCNRSYPSRFIEAHVSSHLDEGAKRVRREPSVSCSTSPATSREGSDKSDALSAMMSRSQKKSIIVFSLRLMGGKLDPVIYFDKDKTSETDTVWSQEVALRNFMCDVGGSGFRAQSSGPYVLRVCTNIPPLPEMSMHDAETTESSSINIPLLKSMIQKAFRRGLVDAGAILSLKLLTVSPEEFLRRIPIVFLEDGMLHCAIPVLVWLMVAVNKGYRPPRALSATCLQVYMEATSHPFRDFVLAPGHAPTSSLSLLDLPAGPARTIVGSILIRAAYGGMGPDMRMLKDSAAQWIHRFSCSHSSSIECKYPPPDLIYLDPLYIGSLSGVRPSSVPAPVDCDTLPYRAALLSYIRKYLTLNPFDLESEAADWAALLSLMRLKQEALVAEGIDFHCDRRLIPFVLSQVEGVENIKKWLDEKNRTGVPGSLETLVKETIWLFRSAINFRRIDNTLSTEESKAHSQVVQSELGKKSSLSGLWRVICPVINDYCASKIQSLSQLLRKISK